MKKIIAIILVAVLALSLGTVAMAKNDNAPGQAKKAETGEVTGGGTTITVTITDEYDDILLNTGKSDNNSKATLTENDDFEVSVEAVGGNPEGWVFEVTYNELDSSIIDVTVYVNGTLYKGASLKDGKIIGTYTWNDKDELIVIDSTEKKNGKNVENEANFITVDKVEAVYIIFVEDEAGDPEGDGKEKSNNGRAHGNNDNFGEPTGNWHKDDDAAEDGYSHPSGNIKDPEGYSTNGNVKDEVPDTGDDE